jgi:hypothetical protein
MQKAQIIPLSWKDRVFPENLAHENDNGKL